MKKIILLLFLVFATGLIAQTAKKEKIKFLEIKQNQPLKGNGYQLVLKQIVSDSRCPEGVQCIWAGEVQFIVSAYKDKKLIEDKTITLSPNQTEDYKPWFAKYMPKCKKNVQSIAILTYPNNGNSNEAKSYYLKIGYLK